MIGPSYSDWCLVWNAGMDPKELGAHSLILYESHQSVFCACLKVLFSDRHSHAAGAPRSAGMASSRRSSSVWKLSPEALQWETQELLDVSGVSGAPARDNEQRLGETRRAAV